MTDTITITGNVATPPELKRTNAGVAITSFRVASGQRRYDRATDSWVDNGTNWYNVSTFRSLAEHAIDSLRKGDRVILSGRVRVRDWDNGVKRGTSIDIEADAIGHDLRFGVSRFTRDVSSGDGRPAQAVDEWRAQEAAEPVDRSEAAASNPAGAPEGETWAVPGEPTEDDETRALVFAGEPTPF
ncbi:single-stranded DNA-binding protein [Microbacterium sp. BWT-B31]|uniref:single-stranded DNA-binding protein n=1 Tax=Microbacterium sp. BWT-B31 TaxID=3232072 RepID=UPI00352861A6